MTFNVLYEFKYHYALNHTLQYHWVLSLRIRQRGLKLALQLECMLLVHWQCRNR